ncbi:guanine nucleotide binding protein, alpha subunit [Collybia nuda]|uniref:Guanine nucleotide binding protein, alpha subunit n=1 Tax=Collybia nuda TaxID=64659 RepID=A0A9P5YED5_9AGAR|nr:guanine nucleotide binding protein, alpha subunit [Collybia nuda]
MRSRRQSIITEDDDPLTIAMAPPPNETEAERQERLDAEKEAQKRSDAIDEELNRQRLAEKRVKCVRVLLLGQSESGKSTTLKNFQLFHSSKAFRTERASWRAVVQLNVVRSIRTILELMSEVQAATAPPQPRPTNAAPAPSYPKLTPEHLKLKMRLSPLQQVEEALLRRLTPVGSADFEATRLSPVTNLPYSNRLTVTGGEVAVNSSTPWKTAFTRLMASTTRTSFDSAQEIDFDDPKDPGVILNACAEDMIRLWNDSTIKEILNVRNLRLEDLAGFFLDSLSRVTSPRYVPTDDDILRARLKTLGVSEHRFSLKAGNMMSHDWRVFDVGGARSLRQTRTPINLLAAWAPYFDNMDAIIFLAPMSGFDQVLDEDPMVNRLEDSILLWKSIVSNPLLKATEIVLFLNKIDIFKAKLADGVQFGKYVVSYGNRPNDFDSASRYLMKKFAGIHKSASPQPRTFYCHLTAVTDVKSTHTILNNVKDMVLRQNLVDGNLL